MIELSNKEHSISNKKSQGVKKMPKHAVKSIQLCVLFLLLFLAGGVDASIINDLRDKIGDRNTKIEELEKEIEQYQEELDVVGEEKKTLEGAVRVLDISRNKVSTDIKITQNRINSTDYKIQELGIEIGDKERGIAQNTEAISKALRDINEIESQSFIEAILAHNKLSDFWDSVETLNRFHSAVRDKLDELVILKQESEEKKQESEEKKREFTNFRKELSDQKVVLDINRRDKNTLLKITENKESNYEKLLEEKVAAREAFERELLELESQLLIEIDPTRIPPAGKGILAWPLDKIKITQYFGNTEFASSGAYNGKGHNGVDFRASSGTRVKTALGGIVQATGNTDDVKGCYSYGKYILVRHNNGLSTLYAHLSLISVNKGDILLTGDVIGYSGGTPWTYGAGYSTGPHLHLSVYASQGVQVVGLGDWYRQNGRKASTPCSIGNAYIPVAPLNAYLNPLLYL